VRVAEIWRYPVKSLQGERLESTAIERFGLVGDRQWGLLDVGTGFVLTARREGRLLFASARLTDSRPVVTLEDGTAASDDAALSAWLGRPVQLVPADGRVGRYEASLDRYRDDAPWTSWEGPEGSFHDSGQTQVSLVSRDSLGEWDRRRFRFNLVLDGGPDASLVGSSLAIGTASLVVVKRISRCVMTTRPQPGGIARDLNVLRTIVADRDGCLGIGALVASPGTVRVGDEVAIA
jgi:MOSC domain-containing protein